MKHALALCLLLAAGAAQAQYRCNVNGEVVYQETSCVAQGKKTEPAGYELYVPSDAGATFVVLEKKRASTDGRLREIVTKRIGRGGHVSYSRRLYDCLYSQVKYLGSGGTYEQMMSGKPDADLSSITVGSIAYYVGQEACKGQ